MTLTPPGIGLSGATIFLVLIELRHFCPNGRALYREALELMSPEDP
jgi:hypothetical protein